MFGITVARPAPIERDGLVPEIEIGGQEQAADEGQNHDRRGTADRERVPTTR